MDSKNETYNKSRVGSDGEHSLGSSPGRCRPSSQIKLVSETLNIKDSVILASLVRLAKGDKDHFGLPEASIADWAGTMTLRIPIQEPTHPI